MELKSGTGWTPQELGITWQEGVASASFSAAPVVLKETLVRCGIFKNKKNAEWFINTAVNTTTIGLAIASGSWQPIALNAAATGFGFVAHCLDNNTQQSKCRWVAVKSLKGCEYACKTTSVVFKFKDDAIRTAWKMGFGSLGNGSARLFYKAYDYCLGNQSEQDKEAGEEPVRAALATA